MEGPITKESQYAPLNLEEFQKLQKDLEGIQHYLPEHLMNPFWSLCNRIRNERVNQPCSCRSSAKHWGKCVSDLKEFVKQRIDNGNLETN